MKPTLLKTIGVSPLAVWLALLCMQSSFAAPGDGAPTTEPARASEPIPWSEIGTRATAQYAGEGLSISAVEGGAVLRCVFQELEGEATSEGLLLTSTVTSPVNDRFRVVASSVGREAGEQSADLQSAFVVAQSRLKRRSFEVGQWKFNNRIRFIRPGVMRNRALMVCGRIFDFRKTVYAGELRVNGRERGGRRPTARGCAGGFGTKHRHSRLRDRCGWQN